MTATQPGAGTDWLKKKAAEATTDPKQSLGAAGVCDTAKVETWLQKFGVRYSHLLDLPLANIDERKSRQNQARQVAVIDDSVTRYAAAMRRGEQFPPVVGYMSGNRVVLIDGNNRDAAARKISAGTIKAYVLAADTPSETIHLMTVDANSHHGVTPDLSWRLNQCAFLVSLGFSVDKAGEAASVTRSQFQEHQRAIRAEQRAKALRVRGFTELGKGVKLSLGSLSSDPVFIQASIVAIETSMGKDDAAAFVRDIKASVNESAMLAVVADTAESRKMEAAVIAALEKKTHIKSPKQGLITGLGKIMHARPNDLARSVVTDIDRAEITRRCYEASEHLLEIIDALAREDHSDSKSAVG